MEEKARITRIEGDRVFLRSLPHEECSYCGKCHAAQDRQVVIVAEDPARFKEGEVVTLCMGSGKVLILYGLLYGVPLFVFLVSVLSLYAFFFSEVISFIGAAFLTAGTYVFSGRVLRKKCSMNPTIRKISGK